MCCAHENSTHSARHSVLGQFPLRWGKQLQAAPFQLIIEVGRFFSSWLLHVSLVPARSTKEKLHIPTAICPTAEEHQGPGTMNQSLSLRWSESLLGNGGARKQAVSSARSRDPSTVCSIRLPSTRRRRAYSSATRPNATPCKAMPIVEEETHPAFRIEPR